MAILTAAGFDAVAVAAENAAEISAAVGRQLGAATGRSPILGDAAHLTSEQLGVSAQPNRGTHESGLPQG